ncbi:MAG TPA: hypothetical protein VK176_13455 [Phycisphaerales bacterium]|nr:hypothetical protein [Phycisphaerales bacterium]
MKHATPLALLAAVCILAGCENKVTLDNYNAITTGMTQSQVEKLLGGKGEKQEVGGVSIGADGLASGAKQASNHTVYVWKQDRAEISVTFVDGKMVDKGQSGL